VTGVAKYPWRSALRRASFRGANFYVETDSKASGRRVALHEYPKRDQPYGEDMGRRARRHTVEGYLVMSPRNQDYRGDRDALVQALEQEGPGQLVHPLLGNEQCICDTYSVSESRERGGYCTFHMLFIEAGSQEGASTGQTEDTGAGVSNAAGASDAATQGALDKGLSGTH